MSAIRSGLDPRIAGMLDLITALSAGDLHARTEPSETGDEIDAVITGLNMLAEELEFTTSELHHERAGLEQSILERTAVLQSVLDNMSEGVIVADVEGNFKVFNKAAAEILGQGESGGQPDMWCSEYGIHYPDSDIVFPPDQLPLVRAMRGEVASSVELLIKNGHIAQPVLINMSGQPVFDYAGKLWGGVIVFRNITRQREYENALRDARSSLESTVSTLQRHNQEADLLADLSDNMMTTVGEEEAYAVSAFFLEQLIPAGSGTLFVFNNSRNILEAKASWGGDPATSESQIFTPNECWALRRGKLHSVTESHTPLTCAHVISASEGYFCVPLTAPEMLGLLNVRLPYDLMEESAPLMEKIGERLSLSLFNLQLRSKLRNLSIRDPLTTLFNRRYLEETFERELSRAARRGQPLGLIMADLDHFKQFNDRYGHATGDELLRSLGVFFRNHSRTGDIACRYGGEEFLLILPDAKREDVVERAEAMRRDIKEIAVERGKEKLTGVTLSFGVAVYPANGRSVDKLVAASDRALYMAKERGRDRVVVAEAE